MFDCNMEPDTNFAAYIDACYIESDSVLFHYLSLRRVFEFRKPAEIIMRSKSTKNCVLNIELNVTKYINSSLFVLHRYWTSP
jgi:hypothetical protein